MDSCINKYLKGFNPPELTSRIKYVMRNEISNLESNYALNIGIKKVYVYE